MTKHWRDATLGPAAPIFDAIKVIDSGGLQIALVVDGEGRLLGVLTDGDIRRAILAGKSLEQPVAAVMNASPTVAGPDEAREVLIIRMHAKGIRQIPLVDEDGRLVGLSRLEDFLKVAQHPNWVVLMAGGFGARLRPLTENCPKPMLKVGDRPILETIVGRFQEHGFNRFVIAVNYLGHMIESHFGNGARFGAEIHYLREDRPLGTAGALGVLPFRPDRPFFVMNADLLTKVNFTQLLQYHIDHEAPATLCVREQEFAIPYGVVNVGGAHLQTLEEKPVQRMFINAGIYVLEPKTLDLIPPEQRTDMTDVLRALLEAGRPPAAFPIREYWMDIGLPFDFQRAAQEYARFFLDLGEEA